MISLTTTARCWSCDWTPVGDPDKQAEKHTRQTGHPTSVESRPATSHSQESRDGSPSVPAANPNYRL